MMASVEEQIMMYNDFIGDQSQKRKGNNVPKHMLHPNKERVGLFFGKKYLYNSKDITDKHPYKLYVGKSHRQDGHVLVVGGAGSGKSSCIAIPTLKAWGGTIFAIDIKGELIEYWKKIKGDKRPSKIFNLTKKKQFDLMETGEATTDKICSYDPFYLLNQSEEDDLVQNAREIAQAIIQIPPDNREPFWLQAAQHILTATILYVHGQRTIDEDGKEVRADFNKVALLIQTRTLQALLKEIYKAGSDEAKMHIVQYMDGVDHSDNKMMAGISAELSNRIMVFAADTRIRDAFAPAEEMFNWEDLETHNIFMRIAEDKLGQWDGAITLMLTQLIRTLERRQDTTYDGNGTPTFLSEHGEVIPPVLLLLDEFPRLGKVDVIQNAVSTLRSKGVTICLIAQSLAQFDKTYGKETRQIIVDNCQYKAILKVTDPENQKIFSDMMGTVNVATRSVGDNYGENVGTSSGDSGQIGEPTTFSDGRSRGTVLNTSASISTSREPIVHPHELATLNDILLMTPEGFCRVEKTPHYKDLTTIPHYIKTAPDGSGEWILYAPKDDGSGQWILVTPKQKALPGE